MGPASAHRTPMATRVIFCALLAGALCGCPLGECPSNDQTLADGGEVNGLAPDRVLAPLLGDHLATLTWLLPNRTTTMHLDLEQARPATVRYDCNGRFDGFEVDLSAHLFTDDGIIDATDAMSTLTIDASGHTPDPQWTWRLPIAPFRSAGVVDPTLDDRYEADLSTPTQKLKPVDGSVQTRVSSLGSPVTIGTFHFLS